MVAAVPSPSYSVLLAEDDPGDAMLVTEAFLARGLGQEVETVAAIKADPELRTF